jgi:hypothetical protein
MRGEPVERARDLRHDGVERGLRGERVLDQSDGEAARQRAFDEERGRLLVVGLPVAAVDEREHRRAGGRRKEIEALARRIAIAKVRLHAKGAAQHFAAMASLFGDRAEARHRCAVVVGRVERGPVHAAIHRRGRAYFRIDARSSSGVA